MKPQKPVAWEDTITNIQARILESLAHYKFLSLSQLLQIGVGTTQYKYLHKQIASLRDRQTALVQKKSFVLMQPTHSGSQKAVRAEDMYYLTKAGKKALLDDLYYPLDKELRLPLGQNISQKDYIHRKCTISFQIYLDQWAKQEGYEIPFFHTYFDKVGNNRIAKNLRAKTKITLEGEDYFIPDAAFKIKGNNLDKFFLFEMYNGRDTGRTLYQLHKHALALTKKYTHASYQLDPSKSYTTILVFRFDGLKNAFIKRVKEQGNTFAAIQKFFICKSMDELEQGDFSLNWTTLLGEQVQLF